LQRTLARDSHRTLESREIEPENVSNEISRPDRAHW